VEVLDMILDMKNMLDKIEKVEKDIKEHELKGAK
jgi:hypothetical protein